MTNVLDDKLKKNDWYFVILCDKCAKIDKTPAHLTKSFLEATVISGFCQECDGIQIVHIPENAKNLADWTWKGVVK